MSCRLARRVLVASKRRTPQTEVLKEMERMYRSVAREMYPWQRMEFVSCGAQDLCSALACRKKFTSRPWWRYTLTCSQPRSLDECSDSSPDWFCTSQTARLSRRSMNSVRSLGLSIDGSRNLSSISERGGR